MDIGEMYLRMFEDINPNLQDVAKSASKYVAKARKRAICRFVPGPFVFSRALPVQGFVLFTWG
jgi:hypothetical protein